MLCTVGADGSPSKTRKPPSMGKSIAATALPADSTARTALLMSVWLKRRDGNRIPALDGVPGTHLRTEEHGSEVILIRYDNRPESFEIKYFWQKIKIR